MINPVEPGEKRREESKSEAESISIVQRGNLKSLEQTLRKQWRMGQNIVLCWSQDERGLLVIFVPHYFLGNYCAVGDADSGEQQTLEGHDNEAFIRDLVSGGREKNRDELFSIAARLEVSPTFIKLKTQLSKDDNVVQAVEQLIKRYGLSYVDSRAVLLFDIAEFSLYTPFEQASQLNSLSYSLNSAYTKLLAQGIEVEFSRTTTGDGYYVWNRNRRPFANQDLFYFMLLVVADNAVARAASRGNTVPVIRTAYHIGSHYELYQAEGVNPTVFSYIVGDVTIELARLIAHAEPHQILVGDFECELPDRTPTFTELAPTISAPEFIRSCDRELADLQGISLSGKGISSMGCRLTQSQSQSPAPVPRRFRVTDKHGLTRYAFNLQIDIDLEGQDLPLGLDNGSLSDQASVMDEIASASGKNQAGSAEQMFDELAAMLKKRAPKPLIQD